MNEYQIMKEALQEIVNPIWYIQDRAEKEGMQVNGMGAVYNSKDPVYLQGIAKKALELVCEMEKVDKEKHDKENKAWDNYRETMYEAWKREQDNKVE